MNGDGNADIVGVHNYDIYVAYSNGDGTFKKIEKLKVQADLSQFTWGFKKGIYGPILFPRDIADIDGDNKPELVGFTFAWCKSHWI